MLFFYIDFLAGFEKQAKNQYKNQYFPNCPLVSPFPFGPQTLQQHQPPLLGGCMSYAQYFFQGNVLSFAKDQDPFSKDGAYPLPRISSITPFSKGCPFSRTISSLCQGMLPLSQGACFEKNVLQSPFFKGCPFSRGALSQGMPFLKGLWQLTLLQGFHPFARISAGIFSLSRGMSKELEG